MQITFNLNESDFAELQPLLRQKLTNLSSFYTKIDRKKYGSKYMKF